MRVVGIFLSAWGLLLGWMGHARGDDALIGPGLAVAASGVWIAGLHKLVRSRPTGLAIAGGLCAGWGAIGGLAAAWHRSWIGAVVCAAILVAGLLLLGVLPRPAWAQKPIAVLRRIAFGLPFMAGGLVFVAVGIGGGASEGVPAFVPVAAGLAFFCAGLLAALSGTEIQDGLLTRTLVALVVSALATAGVVFPPSLLFTTPMAVLCWIAVARALVEWRSGRDPLAGWSDARVLGLGCGISVLLVILLIGSVQLRSCAPRPGPRPPAEAPETR